MPWVGGADGDGMPDGGATGDGDSIEATIRKLATPWGGLLMAILLLVLLWLPVR